MEFSVFRSDSADSSTSTSILAILDAQWMLDLTSFSRRATVIGQIIGVVRHSKMSSLFSGLTEVVRCSSSSPPIPCRVAQRVLTLRPRRRRAHSCLQERAGS